MADSILALHQVIRATTTKVYNAATALGALGTAYMLFKRNPKPAGPSLDTLPIDILIEIFVHLDCEDLVRVRRVCRLLRDATKARAVWLRLFFLDSQDPSRRRIFLDKTLESHSAAELEEVVLKPHKGDFAWTNQDPHIREIDIDPKHELLRILPGGRWCLARSKSSVVCYDLCDTSGRSPSHFVLASNPLPLRPRTRFKYRPALDVDVDTTTPYLTFHFAVYFSRSDIDRIDDSSTLDHPVLQVWKVVPCFDTCGRITKLASQHLCTFDREIHGGCGFLQIHGQYIALCEGNDCYAVFDWVNTPTHLHASLSLDWRDEDNYQYTLPHDTSPYTLLSSHRVLTYWDNDLFVCGIPPVVPPSRGFIFPALPVLWQAKVPSSFTFPTPFIHGPFPGADADVFILVGRDDKPCSLLSIPKDFTSADHPNRPSITSLGQLSDLLYVSPKDAWGTRQFAFLHRRDNASELFLLRRSLIPHPLCSSLTLPDFVFDDFDIPLNHLRKGGHRFTSKMSLDDCSSVVSVQVHTLDRVFLLLFEHA